MNLDQFSEKKSKIVSNLWEFPSRTVQNKSYIVRQYEDGSYDCKDNEGNVCFGDVQTKKAETGRCRHVSGVLKAIGDPVPMEETKIQGRIEEAVKKVERPHVTKTHFDEDKLVSRRMACTSLEAWRDALFQETLNEKQGAVLKYIMKNPGSTDKEIAEGMGWPINTITNRRGELVPLLVHQIGVKKNDTGKNAMTWEATKLALEMEDEQNGNRQKTAKEI
jgi:hypothetical protein